MSSQSDLTARARIRDAAISLFAERGIAASTVRDIAQEAGVSSGLLRHHFGSKEGLRDACDDYALNEITALGLQVTESTMLPRVTPEVMRLQQYLIRSIMDGSPAALAMFDRMLDYGERWLASTDLDISDPRAYLAVISVMKMSMFVMRDQLTHALGQDVAKPTGWVRILGASLEIFASPLITPEMLEQGRKALAGLAAEAEAAEAAATVMTATSDTTAFRPSDEP